MDQQNEVSLVFKSIDIKNKGYITLDDLKDKTDLMPSEIFEMLDLDNDGKLTFEEFEQAFRETTNYDVQMENGNKHRELSIRNLNDVSSFVIDSDQEEDFDDEEFNQMIESLDAKEIVKK